MAKLSITIQEIIPEFIQLAKRGKSNLLLVQTERAVEKLSTMYQEAWINAAMGAALPGLPFVVNSKQYQRTIKRKQINRYAWEVYSDYTTKSGFGVTALLEQGHGPIDLKPGLLNGPKSRMGQNGRYNIVSFRHGSPNSDPNRNDPMPLSVYKSFSSDVKKADAQKKAGAGGPGGTSMVTGSKSYNWGAKYDKDSTYGQRSKLIFDKGKLKGTYTHKVGKYAGMVRLQQSTSRSKRGGYFTFRVVSAASDPMSWIVPEKAPWPIRVAVCDFMRPFAEGILKEAMEADIK
jgi:hypothetical protein